MLRTQIPDFTHVTNQNDPVPNVPPHALQFQHPSGELHIKSVDNSTGDATMEDCPGQENEVRAFALKLVRLSRIADRAASCAPLLLL